MLASSLTADSWEQENITFIKTMLPVNTTAQALRHTQPLLLLPESPAGIGSLQAKLEVSTLPEVLRDR